MRLRSTAGSAPEASFEDALFGGLAPDGGLYMPVDLPAMASGAWADLAGAPVADVATALLAPLLADEIAATDLHRLLGEALDFPLPVVRLDGDTWVLELFHGPTLAFKDVGARCMARFMAHFRVRSRVARQRPLTILVATSGDTGSAVAQAFHGVAHAEVVILYPKGQVSPLQERQFTTLGDNVRALAVGGTFDDCQRLVKEAFRDAELAAALDLTSANSINIGRLLPQMVYYAVGALALPLAWRPRVVVPSGNFGNLAAGLLARRLGVPLGPFLAATNANAVVPEYLAGGDYRPRPSRPTLSNAMDVGDPSNWVRIAALFGGDRAAIAEVVTGESVDDASTIAGITEAHHRYGYVFDPHGAVGWVALARQRERMTSGERDRPAVVLATAHPAKFREVVEPALGQAVPLPARLAACLERPSLAVDLEANLPALRRALL